MLKFLQHRTSPRTFIDRFYRLLEGTQGPRKKTNRFMLILIVYYHFLYMNLAMHKTGKSPVKAKSICLLLAFRPIYIN